jgi:hypothetical protein
MTWSLFSFLDNHRVGSSFIPVLTMRVYIHSSERYYQQTGMGQEDIRQVLDSIAAGTDTQDLVVSVYLLPGIHQHRGTAHVQQWVTPDYFTTKRGKWAFSDRWDVPIDLPPRFKLIRMRLDGRTQAYPMVERDRYDWEFRYASLPDHLATLFAHELHHYRRHHLNLHPREGEQSANRWALQHVRALGFNVEGRRLPAKRRSTEARWSPYSGLSAGTRSASSSARPTEKHGDGPWPGCIASMTIHKIWVAVFKKYVIFPQ